MAIPPLLPQFLNKRRSKLTYALTKAEELGIDRPALVWVVNLSYRGERGGAAEPGDLDSAYATIRERWLPMAAVARGAGLVEERGGRWRVTAKGKAVAKNRFWVPDSLEDYRVAYHAYLQDPDLQDARARWPFVAMWDNHEFSWNGWQSIQEFAGTDGWVPAQTLKVAANQAWFEYQPARVLPPSSKLLRTPSVCSRS